MSANITVNDQNETRVRIEVSAETAEALASLLAVVADNTANNGLETLYEALDRLGPIVTNPGRVTVEENPFAQDEDDDPFNIVVA